MHVPGTAARLSQLVASWGELTVERLLELQRGPIVVTSKRVGEPQQNRRAETVAEALAAHAGGCTLVFDLDSNHPLVRPWLQGCTDLLAPRPNDSKLTVFCSPAGHGTTMHFDKQEVLQVQLVGRKRWRVARDESLVDPVHDWQPGHPVAPGLHNYWSPHPPTNIETLELEPGSLMYLPRGTWHEAVAGDEPSIALSFIVGVITYADLIVDALRTQLWADARGRASVTALDHGRDDGAGLRSLLADVPALLARIRVEDLAPTPVAVTPDLRLRRSIVAQRFGAESQIVLRHPRGVERIELEADEAPVVDWIDAGVSFTTTELGAAFPDRDPASVHELIDALATIGYVIPVSSAQLE